MLDKFLFTPQHLADFVQGELVLKKNFSEKTIESIASITNAQAHQLTFLSEKKFLSDLKQTTAGLVILKKEFLNNPEFVLLSALTEDFEEYGLFMVDTFEKIFSSRQK